MMKKIIHGGVNVCSVYSLCVLLLRVNLYVVLLLGLTQLLELKLNKS